MALVPTTLSTVDRSSGVTLSGGNLTMSSSGFALVRSDFGVNSGKWYWEVTYNSGNATFIAGIGRSGTPINQYVGYDSTSMGFYNYAANFFYTNDAGVDVPGMTSLTTGEKIGFALDLDNGTLKFVRSNVSYTVATGLTGYWYAMGSNPNGTGSITFNFGATAFTNTVPVGYTSGFGFDSVNNIVGLQVDYSPATGFESVRNLTVTNYNTPQLNTTILGGTARKFIDEAAVDVNMNLQNFIPSSSDFYIDTVCVPLYAVGIEESAIWVIGLNLTDDVTPNGEYHNNQLALRISSSLDPAVTLLTVTIAYGSYNGTTGVTWADIITYNTTKAAILNKETHFRFARISSNLRLFVNGVSVATSTTKISIKPESTLRTGPIQTGPYGVGIQSILSQLSFYKATSGTATFTPTYPTPRYSSTAKFSNYFANANNLTSPDGKTIFLNFPNEAISFNSVAQNTGRYYFEFTSTCIASLYFGFVNTSYTNVYNSQLAVVATANRWVTSRLPDALPSASAFSSGSIDITLDGYSTQRTIGVYIDTNTKSWGYTCDGIDYGNVHIGMTGTAFKFVVGGSTLKSNNQTALITSTTSYTPELTCNFGDAAFTYTPEYKYALGFYSTATQLPTTTPAMDSSMHGPGTIIKTNGLQVAIAGISGVVTDRPIKSNFFKNSGKYYFEVKPTSGKSVRLGVSSHTMAITDASQAWSASGPQSVQVELLGGGQYWLKKNGSYITNLATGTTAINGASTAVSNQCPMAPADVVAAGISNVVGFAVDYDTGAMSIYFKSTTSPYPVHGYTVSGLTPGLNYSIFAEFIDVCYASEPLTFNFGATAFELPLPQGFTPGFDSTGYFGYRGYVYNSSNIGISRRVIAMDAVSGEKIAEVVSDSTGKFIFSQLPTNQPNVILMALPNSGENLNIARLYNVAPGVITV